MYVVCLDFLSVINVAFIGGSGTLWIFGASTRANLRRLARGGVDYETNQIRVLGRRDVDGRKKKYFPKCELISRGEGGRGALSCASGSPMPNFETEGSFKNEFGKWSQIYAKATLMETVRKVLMT